MTIYAAPPNDWLANDKDFDQTAANLELMTKLNEIDAALGLSALRADNLNTQIAMGGTPDEQVDVDAECLTLFNATFESKSIVNINLTIDNTAGGANGIDTGVVAIDTLYYIWVIAKVDGTVAGLFSVSNTIGTITLPAGYLYARLIGAIFTDGTSDFIPGTWEGKWFNYDVGQEYFSGNGVVPWTDTDISGIVPAFFSRVAFVSIGTNAGGNGLAVRKKGDTVDYNNTVGDQSSIPLRAVLNSSGVFQRINRDATRAHTQVVLGYENIIDVLGS